MKIYDVRKSLIEVLPEPADVDVKGILISNKEKSGYLSVAKYSDHPYRGVVVYKHDEEGRFKVGDILALRNLVGDWVNVKGRVLLQIDSSSISYIE